MPQPTTAGHNRRFSSDALRNALRITGIYAIFAGLWILCSDQAMGYFFTPSNELVRVSMFKGWLFVTVTSGLLLALNYRFTSRLFDRRWELQRFEVILRSIGDAVIATDLEGRIEFMNPVAEALTGWSLTEARGRPLEEIFRIVNEKDRGTVENPVRQVLSQGLVVGLANHTVLIDRSGNEHPIVDNGAPIADLAGHICGVVLAFRDMSEEQAATQALRDSEGRYRLLTEYAGDWVFWLDAEGRHLYDSPACRLFTGYEPAAFAADQDLLTRCIHPEDRHLYEEHLSHNHNQVEKRLEFRVLHRDGSMRWLSHTCRPIADVSGRFLGRRGSNHDITDRKKTEITLREQQWLLNAIIEGSTDAVFVKNLEGRYLLCNQAAAAIIGTPVSEVLGRTDQDIFPEEVGTRFMAADRDILARGRRQTHEERLTTGDGRRFVVEVTKGPILDTQGQVSGLFGIARDVTERTRTMRELTRLNRTLLARGHSTQALLHAADEGSLLQQVCRIVVDDCGHVLAWIGLTDTADHKIRPVALVSLGEDSSAAIEATWTDAESSPAGRAIREGLPVIFRDIPNDPDCAPWREQAQGMGYSSCIALPLLATGTPVGALTICARLPDAFPAEEVQLLMELVNDLSFGLNALRLRQEHDRIVEILRDSEARHRLIIETAAEGFCMLTPSRQIVEVNDALCHMSGYTREELVGHHPTEFLDEANQKILLEQMALGERTRHRRYELELRRRDGSVVPLLLQASTYFEGDKPLFAFAFITDLTERRQAEELSRRLHMAVEQVSSSVVITDPAGAIQYVNPAFEAVTGYSRAEALGRNPRLLKSGRQDEALYRDLWQTISSGRTWTGRLVNKRKDGTVYTEEAIISPIRDAGGDIVNYVAVKRDISAELALHAEQETLRDQLQQAQKLESVGRLAGGVAHDFNNNLGVILGYVEITATNPKMDPSLRPFLEEIRKAAEHSSSLTRQLLAFARKQAITPQVLKLDDTIASMLKILRRLIGEDIKLSWMPGPDPWPVLLDPAQLDQILANLAVNARDAIGGVGKVRIETANVTVGHDYCLNHPEAVAGDYVQLTVSDSGSGMSPEVMRHIFEPFFTTKPVGTGTGLGLATVFGIVKQNLGFLNVYSEPGQGSCFKIFLPRHHEEVRPEAVAAQPVPVPEGSETILLVEDDRAMLELSRNILQSLGYKVLAANDPAEALRLAGEYSETIDLLISDVVMPEMNGRELLDRILPLRPDLRYFFVSGYTADVIAERGVLDEGVQFLQKPFSRNDLAHKIREVLGA
ncbi:MAG: hypothetical protein BWK76_06450 [Desulfobulbaceae bacterium A2]|nr:MAG: hypothetical protein BWK76_06450 [Desulfobulbaceae bacterium A2]